MPPKNMISVMRNTHMPMMDAWVCCSMSAKWCWSAGSCVTTMGGLSLNRNLLGLVDLIVVVGLPGDGRRVGEVEGWRRRRRHPLQSSRIPGIRLGYLAIAHRPEQVDHGQKVSNRKDRCPCSRKHIQHLKFRRILPIAPRHPDITEHELRKEGQVESDEDDK